MKPAVSAARLSPLQRTLLALLWLVLLAGLGAWLGARLQLSGDLRRFMPEARTPAQHLLLDELGDGPGSRLLLLALSGSSPQQLATQSQALAAKLQADPDFSMVNNGQQQGLEAIPPRLLPYRYLMTPAPQPQDFSAAALHTTLQARVQDLASPAAVVMTASILDIGKPGMTLVILKTPITDHHRFLTAH